MGQPEVHNFKDIVPPRWLEANDHAWLTLYSIALGTEQEFKASMLIELADSIVLAFWGSMTYLDASTLTLRFSPEGEFIAEGNISQRNSGLGAWLVVAQPCKTKNPKNEYALKVNASVIASLLISLTTRNYAYSRVSDNCISLNSDEATASSGPVLGPRAFEKPLLNDLEKFKKTAQKLERMPESEKRRIELSLHWYDKALRSYGVDSFLSNWIAIETLAMPDTSDIKPINSVLAKIYNLPVHEVAERFCVGRIFGLRSKIVHDGDDLTVQAALTDYMCWLYEDLLHNAFGTDTNRLGKLVLSPSFTFKTLLSAL